MSLSVSERLAVLFCTLIVWDGRHEFAQASIDSICPSTGGTFSVAFMPLNVYSTHDDILTEHIQIRDIVGVYHYVDILNGAPHYTRDSAAGVERHLFRIGVRWYFADDTTDDRVRAYFDATSSSDILPPGFHDKFHEDVGVRKPWLGWDGQAWIDTHVVIRPATLVTCGSVIKLQGVESKLRLHGNPSLRLPTSGFNPVAAYGNWEMPASSAAGSERADSYWRITGGIDIEEWLAYGYKTCGNYSTGLAITNRTIVRLQHVSSGKWLHSGWHDGHKFTSVLSHKQEVSLSGDGNSDYDSGDNWILSFASHLPALWTSDSSIQLEHMNTKCHLRVNHEFQFPRRNGDLTGQKDISCGDMDVGRTTWKAAEGVYVPLHGEDDDE